jgi:hypothetical protein
MKAPSAIEAARGRAQSLQLEAEAQQLMAEALAKNASLVEYQKGLR